MARSRFNDPVQPMTLENMRRNGVRRSTSSGTSVAIARSSTSIIYPVI
jgi:hypothetical protein